MTPGRSEVAKQRAIRQCRPVLSCPLMMRGMSDDSRTKGRRRDYVIEQVETVPMTAEQYDQ
ncbi:hypothetical protein AQJ23_00455 [Streptomyces antibioticus]|nr:hypothetical protein AQJ23_00455 [Streptomyces antibioticus]